MKKTPFLSLGGSSPRCKSPTADLVAFRTFDRSIPVTAPSRSPEARQQRFSSLTQTSIHKPVSVKFDSFVMSKTTTPFTQEDKGLYANLPIVNILRTPTIFPNTEGSKPPSFFEADLDKWNAKYKLAIKDRQQYKRKYFRDRADTVLTSNTNVIEQDFNGRLKSLQPNGGQILPKMSEFQRVLKKRKSRQSTNMATVVDFEYRGLSCQVKGQNKCQLSFDLNLRTYEPITDFKAEQAWQYPTVKSFTAKSCLQNYSDKAKNSHYSVKNKFTDRFAEPNVNMIQHTLDKTTSVYQAAEWPASLRNDRQERKRSRSPAK